MRNINLKQFRIWVKCSLWLHASDNSPLGPLEGQCEDPETRYQRSWWRVNRATAAGDCVAPRRDGTSGALPLGKF